MNKYSKSNYGCCLIEILLCVGVMFTGYYVRDMNKDYLVEETGFIHSTGNEDKCPFIRQAHEKGYSIKRIERKDAARQMNKICKDCFSLEDQASFNASVQDERENALYIGDGLKWFRLKYGLTDYSELYVYMEDNGVLHINGGCGKLLGKKKNLKRTSFANVNSFKSTCEDCVDAELVEFIYKAVYKNVYDKNLIRESNDD